jgi:hypothetical protein
MRKAIWRGGCITWRWYHQQEGGKRKRLSSNIKKDKQDK